MPGLGKSGCANSSRLFPWLACLDLTIREVNYSRFDLTRTSTTIVLLGNEDHSLDQEDLLSELVTEAGISNLPTDVKEDAEYDELAIEILNAEEPKVVKKRLKYDRKLRFEDNTFAKRQKEIEAQIEQFKRSHSEAQNEITELEIRLRSKQAKLDSIQNEIKKYSN